MRVTKGWVTTRSQHHIGWYKVPCKYCHKMDKVIAYGDQQVIKNGAVVKKNRWYCSRRGCEKTFTTWKKAVEK